MDPWLEFFVSVFEVFSKVEDEIDAEACDEVGTDGIVEIVPLFYEYFFVNHARLNKKDSFGCWNDNLNQSITRPSIQITFHYWDHFTE